MHNRLEANAEAKFDMRGYCRFSVNSVILDKTCLSPCLATDCWKIAGICVLARKTAATQHAIAVGGSLPPKLWSI
jgi:hypothetical protein